ncbi:MAG: rRNA pseudouridine synthase [Deltaproteobacteria bacterium]|nr:rRNA pseudouridine synthase [Deltaproteobacteria bacterium]
MKRKSLRKPATPRPPRDRPPKKDAGRQVQRVNSIISSAGLTSRRNADNWIKSGRVIVNGRVVTEPGAQAVWGADRIEVDGREIPEPSPRIYLMLNKPFGYICSLKDPQGRPLVTDILEDIPQRVYPVGRLDFDTLGLLLLTTHPRYRVPRTYKVTIAGKITDQALNRLRKGVRLKGGSSGSTKLSPVSLSEKQSVFRMTITQGKSRQVRRMLEAVGHEVIHLIRIGFGMLTLGNLKVGEYRYLETDEIASMKKLVGLV